ncbi:uncharacterized protein LOC135489111 [Lineus longissimus]|uniref:uncharacterized protein LOC135489111 n=1 Tax=Lineus longissimus TaxID=88925 RepID=UPI00315C861F
MALPRQPQKMRFSFKLNSLWTIWFCALIVSIEVYLIIQTINNYLKYNNMIWPEGTKPDSELNVTIVFAVFSLLCLPFFVMACVFKVGNFANDGALLGKDPIKEIFRKKQVRGRAWKVWRNFCPIAQTVHVVSAFLLLLPKPLLEGRIIKSGVLTKGAIWWTDLTMMFPNDRIILTNTTTIHPAGTGASEGYVSLQFINYATALFMLMIRYPSVYWYTSRPFSCIFSFQLFMLLLQSLIAFCGFSVVFKAQVNRDLLPEVVFTLNEGGTVVLFLIASLLTFVQNLAVFEYGYHHYVKNRKVFRHRLHPSFQKPTKKSQTCQGYIPHICAMGLMLGSVIFKAAIVYDGGMIYRWYNDRLLLWYIILEVCYLFFWIILWFALTVKQEWDFKFKFPYWHEKTNVFTIQNGGFRDSSNLDLTANEETQPQRYETFVDGNETSNPTTSVTTADVIVPSAPVLAPDVCAIKTIDQKNMVKSNYERDSTKTATIGSNHLKGPAPVKMPEIPLRSTSRSTTPILRDHPELSKISKNRSGTPVNNYLGQRRGTPYNSLPGTPANSVPTTPVSSRPTTPVNSRPTTPKPKSRDHPLNRSDRKKRNRVTFEDCVRNGNYSDDTDEEPACDEEDLGPDSSNCSTSSQEGKPDPQPVGILKKPNRPQSPNPADIASALEGIKNAAKQLKPGHGVPEGALQPQIRSKLNRSNSRSSDVSLCSDIASQKLGSRNSDNYADGSLPRHFRSATTPGSDYADYYSLQDFPIGGIGSNSRGNPNYSSSGKNYNSKSRAPEVARPRTPIEGVKPRVILPNRPHSSMGNYDPNQPDSGVELSDSSTVTTPYGINSPRGGPLVFLNNTDYFTPGGPGSNKRDSANYSMTSSSSPESTGSDEKNNPNNPRLCSQV